MKGKNVAKAAGIVAGLGGLALILLSRKAGAAPPPEPPPEGMAKLYGRVTDSSTGQGIAGVRVTTTGAITETDSSGDYATIDIPPGSWGVRFEKDGYETKELTVSIEEGNNELNMQLVSTAAPPGVANFMVSIINLPSEANMWGCAFQDPTTGEYYQPTNRPIMGSHLFGASESAELSSPVSSGILSISAFSQASAMEVTQIVNYQINMSVTNNGSYVFDFSTGKIV